MWGCKKLQKLPFGFLSTEWTSYRHTHSRTKLQHGYLFWRQTGAQKCCMYFWGSDHQIWNWGLEIRWRWTVNKWVKISMIWHSNACKRLWNFEDEILFIAFRNFMWNILFVFCNFFLLSPTGTMLHFLVGLS